MSGERRKQVVWASVGVILLLAAVYLPELGAAGWVEYFAGKEKAGAADQADVVALARWVLLVVGVALLAWPGRALALEAVLAGAGVLVVVAAVAAVVELGDRVLTKDEKPPAEAKVTRSFAIPAAKAQTVAGDLPVGCVRVVLVRGTDEDTADAANALTYTDESYDGKLPDAVKAGKPSAAVTVELDATEDVDEFATGLTAAEAAYLLGC